MPTRDDVIRMAREAGMSVDYGCFFHTSSDGMSDGAPNTKDLANFAALVAAADRETVSAVLAKALDALQHYTEVVETINDPNSFAPKVLDIGFHARDAIAAIRALK